MAALAVVGEIDADMDGRKHEKRSHVLKRRARMCGRKREKRSRCGAKTAGMGENAAAVAEWQCRHCQVIFYGEIWLIPAASACANSFIRWSRIMAAIK